MTFPDTQGQQTELVSQETEPANGTGEHPWSHYMEDLPESVRPLVEPIFKDWEGNVTQRFQKVHSEYEPLKGFKDVLDNGWELNDVQEALRLAAAINENPQAVYEALKNSFNFDQAQKTEQGQGNQNSPDAIDFSEDDLPPAVIKELQELRTAQEQINSTLTAQQEMQQQQLAEQQLNQLFKTLHDVHGDFDEGYAAYLMYQGVDPNEAGLKAKVLSQPQQQTEQPTQNNIPVVMGSGGGLPTESVNPATMSDKERKELVANLVRQHAEASKEP